MGREEFVNIYGGIYEQSPWVAEQAWDREGNPPRARLAALFESCVNDSTREQKLALIRAHPDLAGRAAIAGELTKESSEEQRSASLDKCTAVEFECFQLLNSQYKQKFGFPFVMAVRNSSRREILAVFKRRLGNNPQSEFKLAIDEIHKIARMRLFSL